MEIKITKLKKDAIIPSKRKEDAGYDIYACVDTDNIVIKPLETKLIATGIAIAIPNDYYMQIEERGSTGSKGIKKSAGVIDSGYRGEIFIAITNCNDKPLLFTKEKNIEALKDDYLVYPLNKAIAQGIIHKVYDFVFAEVNNDVFKQFSSKRGNGVLGSSGK